MEWELEIIKALQRCGSSFTDYLLYFFTQFGTELFFMIAVMLIYWCLDKKEGYRLVNLFMASQLLVGLLKVGVKRIRPYYYDEIKPIMERTKGYSFPSGHSNNIAVIGTDLSIMAKRKCRNAFKYAIIASNLIIILVMLSRMYLGQHFLTDVITGCAIGIITAILGTKIFDLFGDKEDKTVFVILPGCIIIFIAATIAYVVYGKELDSVMTVAGTYSAAALGYFLEKKFVGYEIKTNKTYKYFIRFILGAIIAIALKVGFEWLGKNATGVWGLITNGFIGYFLIGFWITFLAPLAFKKLEI